MKLRDALQRVRKYLERRRSAAGASASRPDGLFPTLFALLRDRVTSTTLACWQHWLGRRAPSTIRRRPVQPAVFRRLCLERLETRIAPAVTAMFSQGVLTISSDTADRIAIEINGGDVQINNADPGTGPLSVNLVTSLSITGGPGGGTIDLSQLVPGALPNFVSGNVVGNGSATLVAPPNQANTWFLTGVNQGNLDGSAPTDGGITFQGCANLIAGSVADTFNYEAPNGQVAEITGSITSGGTLAFDGATVTLAGNITTQGGDISVNDPSVLGSGGNVNAPGQLEIETQGGPLSMYADTITLGGSSSSVILSTRDLPALPGDPAHDASVGDSGTVTLNAGTGGTLTLGSDSGSGSTVALYSQVDSPTVTAGAINLSAGNLTFASNVTSYGPLAVLGYSSLLVEGRIATQGADLTVNGDSDGLSATVTTEGGSVNVFGSNVVSLGGSIDTGIPGTTVGGSITVNNGSVLGTGDSVTVPGQLDIDTQGGALTVYADTINVGATSGSVTISTRDLDNVPGNPASDLSVGDSGNIDMTGQTVTLGSAGASGTVELYTQVEYGSPASVTMGTIDLGDANVTFATNVTTDGPLTLNAPQSITLAGTIMTVGTNLTLNSQSVGSTAAINTQITNVIDAGVGGSVEVIGGTSVTLGGSITTAGGTVTIAGPSIILGGSITTAGGTVTINDPTVFITGNFSANLQGTIETGGGSFSIDANTITCGGSIDTAGGDVTVNDSEALGTGGSVTLQGSLTTGGGNLTVDADTITADTQAGPVVLSTRDVSANADQANAMSMGNSGTINFSGINITLGSATGSEGSAGMYSQVEAGSQYTAGAVNLTVLLEAGAGTGSGFDFPLLPDFDSSSTSITLNDAVVMGGAIGFTANSENLHATTTAPNNPTPTVVQTVINFFQNFKLLGGLAASNASATIDLGPSSSIVGSSFSAMAQGLSDAECSPMSISGVDVAMAFVITNASVNAAGDITTTGDITLDSMAKNTVLTKALENGNTGQGGGGIGAGAAVALETSTSSAIVADTAQLNAGGNLTVQANTENYKAMQVVTTTEESGNIGFGIGIADTNDTTTAELAGTATIKGTTLIQANETKFGVATNQFYVIPTILTGVAVNAGVGTNDTGNVINNAQGIAMAALINALPTPLSQLLNTYHAPTQVPSIQFAAAAALDFENNTATASIGANAVVYAVGDLTVDANTNDRPNVIASSGDTQQMSGTSGAASVAVAIGQYTNTATSFIDTSATVNCGAKLSVTSETLNDFELNYDVNIIQAIGQQPNFTTNQASPPANDVTMQPNDIVEDEGNNASGTSGDWYQYEGAGTVPNFDLTTTNFGDSTLWTNLGVLSGPGWTYKIKNVIGTFTTYLDNSFGVDNNLADTWSQATTNPADNQQAANTAFSGSLTWLTLDQTSHASINSGAQINQSKTYRTGAQSVFVLATDSNSSLNLGGTVQVPGLTGNNHSLTQPGVTINFGVNGLPSAGTQSGQLSIGGAFALIQYTDNVAATIDAGVNLYADSLDVDGETAVGNFSLLVSGVTASGSSTSMGFNGVVSCVVVNDTTLAQIAAGSIITVGEAPVVETFPDPSAAPTLTSSALTNALPGTMGTDASGDITDTVAASTIVQAHDSLDLINLTGGITTAQNLGIGASVGYDEVTRDTEAYIGDANGSQGNGSTATLDSEGAVIVDAKNNGNLDALSVAAAAASGNSNSTGSSAPQQGGQYGVGISGDVSFNQISDTTLAYVHDAAVTSVADLSVNATNQTQMIALAGSVAWITNPQGTSVGIAGSYTENDLDGTTNAFLDNATVNITGTFTVDATNAPKIYAMAASGSFASNNQGIAVAGQVSINSIGITTLAQVLDQSSVTAGNVAVTAADSAFIFAIAGALAYGGRAGVGASVCINTIPATGSNSVWTVIQDSDVTATNAGTVDLSAQSQEQIDSITAAIGASMTGMAAALALSINTISPDTEVSVQRRRQAPATALLNGIIAAGGVTLNANDTPTIEAIAGGAGVTGGLLGIGPAFAVNQIGVNVAGFGSGAVSGTVSALIQGTSVNAGVGTVQMTATSTPTIEVLAAAIGAAVPATSQGQQNSNTKIGGGFGIAINDIVDGISATIDSTIVTAGTVTVGASSTAQIDVLALGGGGAVASSQSSGLAIAGAGAVAVNEITDTVNAGIQNGSTVTTTGSSGGVSVTATDMDSIASDAGGFALAASNSQQSGTAVSFGASIAYNSITTQVEAWVTQSMVFDGGALGVTATAAPTITANSIAGAVSGATGNGATAFGLAGTVSDNSIQNTVTAAIGSAGNLTQVTTPTGDAVTVQASDGSSITANAGGLAVAVAEDQGSDSGFAIGAAVAVNNIGNTINATIDNATVSSGAGINVTATGNENIGVVAVGIAGALGEGQQGGLALTGAGSFAINTVSNTFTAAIDDSTSTPASAPAGTPAIAATDGDTNADQVVVQATDGSSITATAGSVGLGVAIGQSGGVGLGIGVSVSVNQVSNSITTAIDDATVAGDGGVTVSATSTEQINALTVAGALAAGASSESYASAFAGAGAVADNSINNNMIEASITDGSIVTSGNGAVDVNAQDQAVINAAAGEVAYSFAVGSSNAVAGSFGASVAINSIQNTTVEAEIDDSTVTGAGVSVTASGNATIVATTVAESGGVGGGENAGIALTGAGAGSGNTISGTVTAVIGGGSQVTSTGSGNSMSVTATDADSVQATAIGFNIGAGVGGEGIAGGAGAAAATNTITDTTTATIEGSTATASGDVTVQAESMASIIVFTLGLSGALAGGQSAGVALTGAGSGSGNQVDDDVEASIKAGTNGNTTVGSKVTSTGGAVNVTATNAATINASAGAGALGVAVGQTAVGLAVGLSIATNTIGSAQTPDTVSAFIDDSTATGALGVNVTAQATSETIDALTIAGSVSAASSSGVAIAFAGAGAGSENSIYQTVDAEVTGGSIVTSSAGAVNVNATDNTTITAGAGVGAVGVSVGSSPALALTVGASVAINTTGDTAEALVDNSTVTANGSTNGVGVGVTALSTSQITAGTVAAASNVAAGGSVAVGVNGAGASTSNTTTNTVNAIISGGSTVTSTASGAAVQVTATDNSSISATSSGVALTVAAGTVGAAVGVGAAIANNTITNAVLAAVEGSKVIAAGDVDVTALSGAMVNVFALGLSGSLGAGSTVGAAAAGAGSASGNVVTDSVVAAIEADASNTPSNVQSSGVVAVTATDNANITAKAGALDLAISVGSTAAVDLAVGVSLSNNTIGTSAQKPDLVSATIDDSTVKGAQGVIVAALTPGEIIDTTTIAGSASVAGSGFVSAAFAGAGAVSQNSVYQTVTASITGGSTVPSSAGYVSLQATDHATITATVPAYAVTVAGSSGGSAAVSVGAAIASNTIGDSAEALIDNSTVTAAGGVAGVGVGLTALSTAQISATTVATGVSVAGGTLGGAAGTGAGASTSNTIGAPHTPDMVAAVISGGSIVTSTGHGDAVTLSATDNSSIQAMSLGVAVAAALGGAAGAAISVGAALADNTIYNAVLASVEGSTVTAVGDVNVTAASTATIDVLAVGAAGALAGGTGGAGAGAGAGSDSGNTIQDNVEASVQSEMINGTDRSSDVTSSDGAVSITATDSATIKANAGAFALDAAVSSAASVGLAVGVSLANNAIGASAQTPDMVSATITDSTVNGADGVSLTAQATTENIQATALAGSASATASAGFSGALAGAGAATQNYVYQTVAAQVTGGSIVTSSDSGVTLDAEDSGSITAQVPTLALAATFGTASLAVSVGAAIATNTIGDTAEAQVDDSKVTAKGGSAASAWD